MRWHSPGTVCMDRKGLIAHPQNRQVLMLGRQYGKIRGLCPSDPVSQYTMRYASSKAAMSKEEA